METPTIIIERHECVPFSDLDADVQEKVIEQHGDWNVDCNEWWDYIYDHFAERCKDKYGITVDLSNTHFSGFSSQGDGAAFAGSVTDIDKFLATCGATVYVNNQPFCHTKQAERLIRYMFNETGLCLTACRSGHFSVVQSCDINRDGVNPHEYRDGQEHLYNSAELVLDTLEACWSDVCTDLAHELYRSLEQEYNYLTGIDALSETFDANECVFDIETGEMFHIQDAQKAA